MKLRTRIPGEAEAILLHSEKFHPQKSMTGFILNEDIHQHVIVEMIQKATRVLLTVNSKFAEADKCVVSSRCWKIVLEDRLALTLFLVS